MHIFMDETGPFTGIGKEGSVSLIGAIVVPDSRLPKLERAYRKLRSSFPLDDKGEVKGRLLNETQVASVISALHEHSALYAATAIDLSYHTEAALQTFKEEQAEKITANLTNEHPESLKRQAREYRATFEGFSLNLMVQSMLTFVFLPRLIEQSVNYFSMRRPEELTSFHWLIDAKGNTDEPTSWEEWWSTIILTFMETRGFKEPFKLLPIGDYSQFKRFETEPTEWLKMMAGDGDGDGPAINLSMILQENFKFSKEATPGLELVDIVTNATRRALKGNLQKPGWKQIPTLMVHNRPDYIDFVILGSDPIPEENPPYVEVIKAFRRDGRQMIPKHLIPKARKAAKG